MHLSLHHKCLVCLDCTKRTPSAPLFNVGSRSLSLKQQRIEQCVLAAASGVHDANTKTKSEKKGMRHSHNHRYRKKVNSWTNPDTPSKGLVPVIQQTEVSEAAAYVTQELIRGDLTRVVARNLGLVPKAIDVIDASTELLQKSDSSKQQQGEAAEQDSGKAAEAEQPTSALQQLVMFQPVQVRGMLAAPPALPEGAVAFYTYKLSTDSPTFTKAMRQRAQQAAAAAAATSSDGSRKLKSQYEVGVGISSDVEMASEAIVRIINTQGWAQLTCHGGSVATFMGMEAVLLARDELYKQHRTDVPEDLCVVPLKCWEPADSLAGQQDRLADQALPQQADSKQQQQQQQELPGETRPHKCSTFLLLGCARNKPFKLTGLPV